MRCITAGRPAALGAALILAAAATLAADRPRLPDQAKPPAGGPDACTLLTRQDASAAIGGTVGDGKPISAEMGKGNLVKGCKYTSGENSLQLTQYVFTAGAAEVQVYSGLCAKKEQAAGLGDIACWYDKGHRELQVLKGSTILIFQISRGGDATDTLKDIARKVLERM